MIEKEERLVSPDLLPQQQFKARLSHFELISLVLQFLHFHQDFAKCFLVILDIELFAGLSDVAHA